VAPVVFGAAIDITGYSLAFQTLGIVAFLGIGAVALIQLQGGAETNIAPTRD
jgi:hypothetical protein